MKIIEKIIFIFCIIMISLSVYSYYSTENSNKTYLFGFKPIVITTDLLSPELKKDALAIAMKSSEYKVNDIVVYENQERVVTHRLKEIKGNKIVTESNAGADSYTKNYNDIDSKIVFSTNLFSKIISRIREDPLNSSLILFFECIGLLILFRLLFELIREIIKYIKYFHKNSKKDKEDD